MSAPLVHHAVVTRGHGGAIVTAEWPAEGRQTVTAIERFPYDAGPIVRRVQQLKADDPDWSKLVVRSDEVPTISPDFLASERRGMSPDAYAQEYECVFGKAGAALFTLDRINALFGEAS